MTTPGDRLRLTMISEEILILERRLSLLREERRTLEMCESDRLRAALHKAHVRCVHIDHSVTLLRDALVDCVRRYDYWADPAHDDETDENQMAGGIAKARAVLAETEES